MASLNKVILIGRLGRDPEITTFESGNKKMSVSLATTERYRDRDNNWIEQTEWHSLVAWGNLANDIADKRRNYAKGDMMYVEGRLRSRQYVDSQGINRTVTEIQVDKLMQLVAGRPAQQSSYGYNNYSTSQETVYQAPATDNDPLDTHSLGIDNMPF